MAAGNQRGDHLALHAVDAHLLAPGGRAQRGPVADGRVGGGGGGGGAVTGRGEGRAVGGEPVGVGRGSAGGGAQLAPVDALGLGVLQGLGAGHDGGEAGGPRLTALEDSTKRELLIHKAKCAPSRIATV